MVRGSLACAVAASALAQFVGFLPMLAQKHLFDAIERWVRGLAPTFETIALPVALMVATATLSEMVNQGAWYVSERAQRAMAGGLELRVSDHLLRLSLGYHVRHDSAEKLGVVTRGLEAVCTILWVVLVQTVPNAFLFAVYLAWTYALSVLPAMAMIGGCVLLVVYAHVAQGSVRSLRHQRSDAVGAAETFRADVVRNVRAVKTAAAEPVAMREMARRVDAVVALSGAVAGKMVRMQCGQSVVRNLTKGIVLSVACWEMARGNMTLGTFTVVYAVSERLADAALRALQHHGEIERSRADAEKLFGLLDERSDVPVPQNPVRLGTMLGSIALEGVSFAYPNTPGTIQDVTLYVPAGRTVAIVGPSGAGKSTIASLMLRAFDPHAGTVRVDGIDLRLVDPAEYLSQVGVVSQGNAIFNLTAYQNIALGRVCSREDVERAARMAGAHEFIERLPEGYETRLGESGVRLSGGQAQRIAIARALLGNPRILILDEATSHLDAESEAHVMRELVERIGGTLTIVIIAHRMSTIRKAHKIAVIEGGSVTQCGTYEELRFADGAFRRLADLQEDGTAH